MANIQYVYTAAHHLMPACVYCVYRYHIQYLLYINVLFLYTMLYMWCITGVYCGVFYVSAKNTAVCCLTARKSPRNSSLPLGVAIYILRKMPRKPEESSVECYGHGFLIAARPRGV